MALGCAYCVFGAGITPPDTVFYLGRDSFKTPVYAFYGKEKGPVMVLDGGIHGDEVAGQYACDSIVKHIRIQKGTLYVIPRVNVLASRDTVRFKNVDLNRTFPGDTCWVDYEYTLSYQFMQLMDSLNPKLVINLHEARTHVSKLTTANKDKMAFGQTLIYVGNTRPSLLAAVQKSTNAQIATLFTTPHKLRNGTIMNRAFRFHRFPFMASGSLDNMYYRLGISSYTVETWREYELPERVKMQTIISLEFMKKLGIKYTFPN